MPGVPMCTGRSNPSVAADSPLEGAHSPASHCHAIGASFWQNRQKEKVQLNVDSVSISALCYFRL